MGVPPSRLLLNQHLAVPQGDEIPVIPLEALVLLKLDAGRPQDIADIQTLVADADVEQISEYLKANAPEHLNRFSKLINPK